MIIIIQKATAAPVQLCVSDAVMKSKDKPTQTVGLSNIVSHLETNILLCTVFCKDMHIACSAFILILKTSLPILNLNTQDNL